MPSLVVHNSQTSSMVALYVRSILILRFDAPRGSAVLVCFVMESSPCVWLRVFSAFARAPRRTCRAALPRGCDSERPTRLARGMAPGEASRTAWAHRAGPGRTPPRGGCADAARHPTDGCRPRRRCRSPAARRREAPRRYGGAWGRRGSERLQDACSRIYISVHTMLVKPPACHRRTGGSRSGSQVEWHPQPEGRALRRDAHHLDGPPVPPQDVGDDGQAESGSAKLGGEERLEDLV